MARFFFHVFDDQETLDDEGAELPDLDAARARAIAGARSLICECVARGRVNLDHRIEVADESGARCLTIRFRDVVTIEG